MFREYNDPALVPAPAHYEEGGQNMAQSEEHLVNNPMSLSVIPCKCWAYD